MCRPITCKVCRKTTWAGCGEHIASVKATVPDSQWCDGTHEGVEPKGTFGGLFGGK
ncbi:MAG: hypothetical protein ACRCWS_03720 [Propionibacteriaceae bacterium]